MLSITHNASFGSRNTIITVTSKNASQAGLVAQAMRTVLDENRTDDEASEKRNELDTLYPGLVEAMYSMPPKDLLSSVRDTMGDVREEDIGYVVYRINKASSLAGAGPAGEEAVRSSTEGDDTVTSSQSQSSAADEPEAAQSTYKPHHRELCPPTTTGPLTAFHLSAFRRDPSGDIDWGDIPAVCSSIMTSTPGPTVFVLPDNITSGPFGPGDSGATVNAICPEPTDLLAAIAEIRDDARRFGEFVSDLTDAGVHAVSEAWYRRVEQGYFNGEISGEELQERLKRCAGNARAIGWARAAEDESCIK